MGNKICHPAILSFCGISYRLLRSRSRRLLRSLQDVPVLNVLEASSSSQKDAEVVFRPQAIAVLEEKTKFTRKELQMLYRGFKEAFCKSSNNVRFIHSQVGKMLHSTQKLAWKGSPECDFSQIRPTKGGGSGRLVATATGGGGVEGGQTYSSYVFKTFDIDGDGQINFEEFVMGLSILSRGNEEQKMEWIFHLYDINQDGQITPDEIQAIVSAVQDIMGPNSCPPLNPADCKAQADQVFQRMDLRNTGAISWDDFYESMTKDESFSSSLRAFNTVFVKQRDSA